MSIRTGSYVGTGVPFQLDFGATFRPVVVFVKADSASYRMAVAYPGAWCAKTNFAGAQESFVAGLQLDRQGVRVGSSANVNAAGVTYYWLALDGSAEMPLTWSSWMGNQTSGNVMPLRDTSLTPAAVFIKRDNPLSGVVSTGASTLACENGAVVSDAVLSFGAGSMTLGAATNVNQLDGPNGVGEGIDGIAWGAGSAVATGSTTGTGAALTITTGWQPRAVFWLAQGLQMRLATDVTAPAALRAGLAANGASEVTLTSTGFQVASAISPSGLPCNWIAIKDHADGTPVDETPTLSGRKVVFLSARHGVSYINCGQSDTLRFSGAHSLEWYGSVEFLDPTRGVYAAMMIRGGLTSSALNAVGDVVNSYQTGLVALAPNDFSLGWGGPQVGVIVSDRYVRDGDIRKTWRSGILCPHGRPVHWMATHDGTGKWRLYQNGRLVKARNYDMTLMSLANTQALTGRPMVLGAIYSAQAFAHSQRMTMALARIYSRELTPAECYARFRREAMQDTSYADVSSGLLDEWAASNASGNALPATVNSANNGAIVGGMVLTA